MVKLSIDTILKFGPGQNKRRADESVNHYLNRLTHIYYQDKSIDEVSINQICKALTVIYLYDNNLSKIENFEFAPNLTHLYLQNNKIKRLTNLNNLMSLEKLHIGGNQISVVEGLENLNNLEELHIENQNLPMGEKLIFEPRTLLALSNKLTVLNVSNNGLDSLSEIGSLINLQTLLASNNLLDDMKEIGILLTCWPRLAKLDLSGNMICFKNKYRERLIVLAPNLLILDGKEIQETSRQFLQNWKISKEVSHQKSKQDLLETGFENQHSQIQDSIKLRNGTDSPELPKLNRLNQLPTYVMPDHRKKQMSLSNQNKQQKRDKRQLEMNKFDPFSMGKSSLISQKDMSNSLSSIHPSTVKTNSFSHRFTNLSARNKFTGNSNHYMDDLRMNLINNTRNQHVSSASPFINMNSNKNFNRSLNRLELNSADKH